MIQVFLLPPENLRYVHCQEKFTDSILPVNSHPQDTGP
jgi:hypothetical protein